MRPFYMISKDAIVVADDVNALAIVCTATQKGILTRCALGASAVAALSMTDDSITWLITRLTAAVTGGTAITPTPTDKQSPASALTACKHTSTVGTLEANGILFGLNRRSTFHFVANPGEELTPDIGTGEGVVLRAAIVPTAYNCDASMVFQE